MQRKRIAVLIDLPREKASGGHVKYWERVAQALAQTPDLPVDLTFYFSGPDSEETLSPQVKFRSLPPVFSTAKLKFLPYVPAHTDLAPFHPALAKELPSFDVIHTTDAFFAFARTAEKIARWNNIPLLTSLHTDTLAYAELFTRQTLHHLFGARFGSWLDRVFHIPAKERAKKEKRLHAHMQQATRIFVMRPEDKAMLSALALSDRQAPLRMGVDQTLFAPSPTARATLNATYGFAPEDILILFVGRVDAGKNMPLLLDACEKAIALGAPLRLLVAGIGPMQADVEKRLGDRACLLNFVEPVDLAKIYAGVDALAIASLIEIGGMIGLEALSCGCPVLVTKQSGIAPLFGASTVMQEIDATPDAWAQYLRDFAANAESRQNLRAAALDFRRDNLADWRQIGSEDFVPVWTSPLRPLSK